MHKRTYIILALILIIGFFLRSYRYLELPRKGATFDEYAWTWLGMNIIQRGVPVAWSPHPQYQLRNHYIEPSGAQFWLVQPYLEHPPLFGLVAGGYALLNGAKDMYSFNLSNVRSLSLGLGVISIFLVFLLTKDVVDEETALIAAAFYATVPTVVIGSRLVQNENFFIPLFLLSTWLTYMYIKSKKSFYLTLSAVLCGLLTLAKVPWMAAGAAQVFLLIYNKKWKDALIFGAIVIGFFSLFFIWGWKWNWTVFINLWKLQVARYDITFDGIFALFTTPYLADRFYLDGWIYVGWFAFFMVSHRFPKYQYIVLPLLAYFGIYVLGIPNEPGHGWYRYPFYPFLIISLAIIIKEAIKSRSLFPFFASIFIGASLLQSTWNNAFGFSYGAYRGFLVICGIFLLPVFFVVLKGKKLYTTAYSMLFFSLLLLNIWAVLSYGE